jgi:hypothetical protein
VTACIQKTFSLANTHLCGHQSILVFHVLGIHQRGWSSTRSVSETGLSPLQRGYKAADAISVVWYHHEVSCGTHLHLSKSVGEGAVRSVSARLCRPPVFRHNVYDSV